MWSNVLKWICVSIYLYWFDLFQLGLDHLYV